MEKKIYSTMEEVLIKGAQAFEPADNLGETYDEKAALAHTIYKERIETLQKTNELIALDLWLLRMEEAQGLMDGMEVELW